MTTQRKKGLARWLVIGLSGIATAGFLGAIVNQAAVQQPTAVPATVQDLNVIATPQPVSAQPSNSASASMNQQSQTNAQPVVRTPRLRSRGS
jgi:hypothetical protein